MLKVQFKPEPANVVGTDVYGSTSCTVVDLVLRLNDLMFINCQFCLDYKLNGYLTECFYQSVQ